MGKHSVVRGEKSSYGQANSSPPVDPDHVPQHARETGSDVPPRDQDSKVEGKSRLRIRKGI